MPGRGWNPRYVAYARVHGRTPDEMLAYDKEKWPGACMCGFGLWIQQRWRDWAAHHGFTKTKGGLYPQEQAELAGFGHDDFDRWLQEGVVAGSWWNSERNTGKAGSVQA